MKVVVKQFKKNIYEASILNEDILNGGELFLGREDDCHIKLDSFQISRYHATISILNEKLTLQVLSNYGGVRVNGNEVKSIALSDEDIVEIGEFEIQISSLPMVQVINDVIDETVILPSGNPGPELEDDLGLNQVVGLGVDDETAFVSPSVELTSDELGLLNQDKLDDDLLGAVPVDDVVLGDDLLDNSDFDSEEDSDSLESENGFSEDQPAEFSSDDVEGPFDGEEGIETPVHENDGSDIESDFSSDNEFENNDEFGNDEFGDNGFGDDEFGDNDVGGIAMGGDEATQVMQSFAKYSLKLFGEYAPFDRYTIEQNEIFIGRDPEKCQIILEDPEVSKVHARIKKTFINCIVEDLDSANGIIYNGERVNKAELTNGDEFIIGDTTFTVAISSDIIEAEKGILMPVEDNQEVEIEEIVEEEVDFDGFENEGAAEDLSEEKSLIKRIMKDPKKKRIALIVIGLFVAMLLLDSGEEPAPVGPTDKEKAALLKKKKEEAAGKNAKYSAEKLEQFEQNYALATAKFYAGEYAEAKEYVDILVTSGGAEYKDTQSLLKLIQEGLEKEIRLKAKEQEEKERKERQLKIATLLEKAREAVKSRQVKAAKNYFNLIFEIDPENLDVPILKLEIEAYVEEEKRKKNEIELKKAARQAKVDKLTPGKTLFLKGEWYKAVDKLEKFLNEKDMDEDLLTEATSMLKESQKKLLLIINPLLSKARSYKEGEDLKQSYESYGDVLKYDPANEEALNQRDGIFLTLKNRSRKIFREALVAESLSLYGKAKEKFQEVQQVSPINSEYYIKASEKLKNYLE
ncbi:MAG: pSer/pThr/pTyr-binding forkhead associated (FHA) protein [Bacteriovoracaceae bacterium]|jgi:pSer/pThr/pTyr-binding forkhead associated (FHA) protein